MFLGVCMYLELVLVGALYMFLQPLAVVVVIVALMPLLVTPCAR